jgi:hypothetical protein
LIVLHALGQCLIRTAVTTITPRADMCFALASYLIRERGKRFPRRMIEQLFWPTMRPADASHSLSELIHKLRRKGLHIHRDDASCIWLPRDSAAIDVESLSTDTLANMAERDLSILPGYTPHVSPAFNDWADDWRDHMQMSVLADVVSATSRASSAQDWPIMLALARQALGIDAENEQALLARARAAEQIARDTRGADRSATRDNTRDSTWGNASAHLKESSISTTWRVRPSVSTTNDTTLVGRDQPMQRLRNKARDAIQGAVCSAYVSAPAGVGKSRLAREVTTWMRANGAVACTVSCERQDRHRPLSVFIQAVPRLQTLPGAAGCAPGAVACLARITRPTNEEPDLAVLDDSLHLSASIRASVIDLINAVTDEQPLLFVVEDMHWIDPVSWSLLRTIAATAQHSLFLICTSRAKWQHSSWGAPEYFRLEELPALEPQDARDHARNYLAKHQRSADDQFITWCADTSSGNPYFVEELVNYWITTGEQYSAPPSLVALVEARLACLQPDALRVIQAAAILGKNSTLELLQQVLEFPTHVLFSSIEELGQAGLLTVSGQSGVESTAPVLCRHDLVIGAATRGLSAQGRALLHHAAARAIESSATSIQSAELLWDCADHWLAAGHTDRSTRAAVACARHLHEMGLVHDAIKRCTSIIDKCQTTASRIHVLRAMAQSQYAARDWLEFCHTVTEVRALETVSTSAHPIHDDLELYELSAQRNLHRDWKGALEQTLRCVRSSSADTSHKVKAAIIALKFATNTGELETMDAIYQEASTLATSPDIAVTDRLTLTMIYHAIRGDAQTSVDAARELRAITERTLPPRHQLSVLIDCAGALRRGGAAGEGQALYAVIFQISVPLQCFYFASEACHRLIEMYCDEGQIEQAAEWVNRYRRLRRPKAEMQEQRNLQLAIARVHLWQGEWRKAANIMGSTKAEAPWRDSVAMFRSGALAMKIRLDIGRLASHEVVTEWVMQLAQLSANLRATGAQDYESYSLYLGYRYIGDISTATQLLRRYAEQERRDKTPLSPEIRNELILLEATHARPDATLGLPEYAGASDGTNA